MVIKRGMLKINFTCNIIEILIRDLFLESFSYLGLGMNSGRFQTLGGKESGESMFKYNKFNENYKFVYKLLVVLNLLNKLVFRKLIAFLEIGGEDYKCS